jgi:ABC-type antimicrobial peptide transport system permease subunit
MIEAGMIGLVGGVIGFVLGIGISKAVEFVAAQQLVPGFYRLQHLFT